MNNKITVVLALLVSFVIAVILGLNIATENYVELSIYIIVGFALWYVGVGWRMTWKIAAVMLIARLLVQQGLLIEGSHLFTFMVALSSVIAIFVHSQRGHESQLLEVAGIRGARILVGIFIAYLIAHAMTGHVFPHRPLDYNLKNAAKAYFGTGAAFGLFFWMSLSLYEFKVNRGWSKSLMWIVVLSVIANFGYLVWITLRGYGDINSIYATNTVSNEAIFYTVPVLNLSLNHHALRSLAPEGVLLLMLFLFNRSWCFNSGWLIRILMWGAVLLCVGGAIMSGGRATLLLCLMMVGVVLVKRRQIGAIAAGMVGAALLVAFVNVFSHQINQNAPLYISRSLQFVMIEKGFAAQTIDSSDDSRKAARDEALKEWRADNRVMLFGRGVYQYLGVDYHAYRKNQVGDSQAFAEMASRAGFTHNLIVDLLIQYGLAGLFLYFLSAFSVIVFFFRLEKIAVLRGLPRSCSDLAFFGWFTALVWLAYGSLAGGYMSAQVALVLGLLKARFSYLERQHQEGGTATSLSGID
jgi:hypothetical protein